jgi:hypothetical protein
MGHCVEVYGIVSLAMKDQDTLIGKIRRLSSRGKYLKMASIGLDFAIC